MKIISTKSLSYLNICFKSYRPLFSLSSLCKIKIYKTHKYFRLQFIYQLNGTNTIGIPQYFKSTYVIHSVGITFSKFGYAALYHAISNNSFKNKSLPSD